ncbi:MAG: glycosyltransferase family 2 protein [Acidobacteria bacterium]|nr:glycosyltransferase family 2 protein [Acidobacteriota bacterium]
MLNNSDVRLSVVIPAYNEELRLPRTLEHSLDYLKAQSYSSEIIVVNDGSVDGTERILREWKSDPLPVKLISHEDGKNHGKGASVRKGMMEAHGAYRLFMDADNSTTADQIDRFWPLFDKGYGVVIGSRALANSVIGARQARYKELAGRFGNWLIQKLAVPGIADTQAGFKMFSAEAAGIIFPRQTIDRWGYDVELLVIARSHHCRIGEVPITWLNASGSKVTLKSYFQVLGDVLRIRRNLKAGLYK